MSPAAGGSRTFGRSRLRAKWLEKATFASEHGEPPVVSAPPEARERQPATIPAMTGEILYNCQALAGLRNQAEREI